MCDNCSNCKGKGFILTPEGTALCVCQRTLLFRQSLQEKGFRLNMVEAWDKLISPAVPKINANSGKSLLLVGKSGGKVFYSYMAYLLLQDRHTQILSSSDITGIYLSKETGRRSQLTSKHLGIVLGFDLTNSIQGKVMSDFLFYRKSNPTWRTIFWLPYNSLRRMESEYGDVFSEYIKEGDLILIEVKV